MPDSLIISRAHGPDRDEYFARYPAEVFDVLEPVVRPGFDAVLDAPETFAFRFAISVVPSKVLCHNSEQIEALARLVADSPNASNPGTHDRTASGSPTDLISEVTT
ncbi:hypothetical protein ACPXCG_16700 [Gordonia sp. DT218]|uniref:hypothetical protein n=1 Tax=Gordonia sp. DT218 TaxID=3416659 RepID=UPI003CF41E07